MRLQLSLQCRPGSRIPFNYQYEISSWIYRTLAQADPAFAEWLHQQGYTLEGQKRFKLFTFSHLQLQPPFQPEPQRQSIRLDSGQARLTLSFLLDDTLEHFVGGLFRQQEFGLGNPRFYPADFSVVSVEILPRPVFMPTMRFRALSPICLGTVVDYNPHAQYLSPLDDDYERLLLQNLTYKFSTAAHYAPAGPIHHNPDLSAHFELLSEPRKKGITLKAHTPQETQVIGYTFDFELTAPPHLLETGYYAGFGEKNAQGFGCVAERVGV